jgi:hypothetical protein
VVGKGHVSGIKKSWQQPIEVRFFFYESTCVYYTVLFMNNKFINSTLGSQREQT